jgi:hypothetical protein
MLTDSVFPLTRCFYINLSGVLSQGQGENSFVEIYNGLNRQFRVLRLNATTKYLFRVAAINSMGKRSVFYPYLLLNFQVSFCLVLPLTGIERKR